MKRPKYPAAVSSSPPQRGSTDFYPGSPPKGNVATFPCTPEPTTKSAAKRELQEAAHALRKGHISDGDYDDVRLRTWKTRYGEGD